RSTARQPPSPTASAYAASADAGAPPCPQRESSPSCTSPFFYRQAGEQLTQLGQLRPTCQHRLDIGEEARHVAQILGLAITVTDARKDADDLEVALHPHQVTGPLKVFERCLNWNAHCPGSLPVAVQPA